MSGLLLAGSILTLIACSGSPASYETRMAYLRKTAARGVESHRLLASQGAHIDRKRCQDAYLGLVDDDIPHGYDSGTSSGVTDQWRSQVTAFFVDSCVSGLPRPVPDDPTPTPARSAWPPATSTPAASTITPAPQPDPAPTGTPAPRGSEEVEPATPAAGHALSVSPPVRGSLAPARVRPVAGAVSCPPARLLFQHRLSKELIL